MGKFTISMVMFHSYVKLPEGKPPFSYGFDMVLIDWNASLFVSLILLASPLAMFGEHTPTSAGNKQIWLRKTRLRCSGLSKDRVRPISHIMLWVGCIFFFNVNHLHPWKRDRLCLKSSVLYRQCLGKTIKYQLPSPSIRFWIHPSVDVLHPAESLQGRWEIIETCCGYTLV